MSLSTEDRALGCLIARWRRVARELKSEIYALYLAYRDPRTPWYARLVAALVAAYALSPVDLIPDPIPVLGHLPRRPRGRSAGGDPGHQAHSQGGAGRKPAAGRPVSALRTGPLGAPDRCGRLGFDPGRFLGVAWQTARSREQGLNWVAESAGTKPADRVHPGRWRRRRSWVSTFRMPGPGR